MTVTVDEIRASMGRMVDFLTSSHGGERFALDAVARKCGISARSLKRFISGQSKENDLRRNINIRTAYRRFLAQKIEEMQAEIQAIDEADAAYDVWDIDLKIAALETKLKERKEGLVNGIDGNTGR